MKKFWEVILPPKQYLTAAYPIVVLHFLHRDMSDFAKLPMPLSLTILFLIYASIFFSMFLTIRYCYRVFKQNQAIINNQKKEE